MSNVATREYFLGRQPVSKTFYDAYRIRTLEMNLLREILKFCSPVFDTVGAAIAPNPDKYFNWTEDEIKRALHNAADNFDLDEFLSQADAFKREMDSD